MTREEFYERLRLRAQLRQAGSPPESRFRAPELEADRKAWMGIDRRKELTVEPEPKPEAVPMPVAPEIGEALYCRSCGAAAEADELQWSPLAVWPQGEWRRVSGRWQHHCRAFAWGEAVNPWDQETHA